MIKCLTQPNVYIKNIKNVENVLSAMMNDGPLNLQLVTDFDQTLTKYTCSDGRKCPTSYDVINNSRLTSESLSKKQMEVDQFYDWVEKDRSLSLEERLPHVKGWYEKTNNNIFKENINLSNIPDMVAEAGVELRDNCDELFNMLYHYNIPTTILSAGLGDVINEILIQNKIMYDNI